MKFSVAHTLLGRAKTCRESLSANVALQARFGKAESRVPEAQVAHEAADGKSARVLL